MVDSQDGTAFEQGEGGAMTLFPLPPLDDEPTSGEGARPAAKGGRFHSLIVGLDNLLASGERPVLWLFRGAGTAVFWPFDMWATLRSEIRSWDNEGEVVVEEPAGPVPGAGLEDSWVAYWRRPVAGPVTALIVLMAVYIGVFGDLTYKQQSNYGTFGFDMGIYDQAIWLLAHFKTPFDTIRGLNYFGQHVNIVTLLFVPAYWLGAGPHFLFAIETVWMAAGAIPIWLLGRDKLHNSWIPLGLSAAYLLYPSVEWVNEWMFHPDALIITPLMFAYWLATRRRWGWFWFATALALSCKEDAGLAVLALGIVLWLKMRQRAVGLITTLAGAAWFLICTRLIIPFANGGGQPFYVALFPSSYGTTVFQIIDTLLFHPTKWVPTVVSATNFTYYAKLLWPVGMVALLEPAVLLIGVPQLLVNTLSTEGYTNNIQYYYTSIIVAAIFLATVEACGRQGRTLSGRRLMVALVFAAALASNVAWSPSPISVKFHTGIWAGPQPKDPYVNEAIALVPKNASVSATYDIDSHMTHRVLIYEYPNPWVVAYWGLQCATPTSTHCGATDNPPNPAKVDWLVLNTTLTGNQTALYLDLEKTEFKAVFFHDGILVLHRVKPGIPNDHNWP
jgi:uncharacterized membrane protein